MVSIDPHGTLDAGINDVRIGWSLMVKKEVPQHPWPSIFHPSLPHCLPALIFVSPNTPAHHRATVHYGPGSR